MAKENQIVIDRVAKFALAFVASAWIAVAVLLLASAVSGCVNPNTGTSTIVGEQMALPEITDSGDNVAVRVYESIKGARVWTAKNSIVSVVYENAYTNSYFGIVETRDTMKLRVKVEPCETDAPDGAGGSQFTATEAPSPDLNGQTNPPETTSLAAPAPAGATAEG